MRVRTMLVGTVAAVAMAVVTACSGGTDSSGTVSGPMADLTNVLSQNAGHRTSAHFEMQTTMPGVGVEAGSGVIQYSNPAIMDINLTTPQGPVEVLLVDNALYVKNQAIAASAPGKSWLKLGLPNNAVATMLQQNTDVSQLVKQLSSAGTVNSVSHEQLDGQSTTHYSIKVDVSKLAANLSDPTLKGLYTQMSQSGTSNYVVDIWLNSDNLPVKAVNTVPVADPTSGKAVAVTSTVTFSDWGQPVTVVAPPADQVTALTG